MSHFYGSIPTSGRRTVPTARAHKGRGLVVRAASWAGAIETRLYYDKATNKDMFEVTQTQHHGAGDYKVIARGIVGVATQEEAN